MRAADSIHVPAQAPSWRRFAGILALYALPGPFVGALAVSGLLTALAVVNESGSGNAGDIWRTVMGGMVILTLISLGIAYALGLVSALGVGLAVALSDRRRRGISWRVALIAALGFWLLVSGASLMVVPREGGLTWLAALLMAHLLAAAFCTWLARRVLG